MSSFQKGYLVFIVGGAGYMLLEILWRGYTHISMGFLGGFCLIMILAVDKFMVGSPLYLKALVCSLGITLAEFISGVLLNMVFKLSVWDYSNMPFNLLGQVCPAFSIIWFLLSGAVLWVKSSLTFLK